MSKTQENPIPRILIVEDETIIAFDLKTTLENFGYAVLGTELSAENGIKACRVNSPDLVLMDIILQGSLDGIAAAEIIRSRWRIPVIFLTAYADRERLKRAQLVYPFGYLIKPFREQDLKVTVEMALYVAKVDAEKRKADEILAESKDRLDLAIKGANAGLWDWDIGSGRMVCNERWAEITGHTLEELAPTTTQTFIDLCHPDDLTKVNKIIREHFAGKLDFYACEVRLKHKDGRWVWVNDRGQVMQRDHEGTPLRMTGIQIDITERKLAGEQVRNAEEKLRALSARIQAVREEERVKIAREIHDDLGQQLTALKLDQGWLLRHLEPDQAEVKEKVRAMGQLIDQTVQTVRRISTELRPRVLDDFGLIPALEWQSQEFAKKTGIGCRFRSRVKTLDLKPDLSIAVFRIFQEALTNVARHSGAINVEAIIEKDAKDLVLTIQDNGRGISSEEINRSNAFGLLGIKERALILGGTVEVTGIDGKGTTISLRLPLSEYQRPQDN